jgi:hypothetical protein
MLFRMGYDGRRVRARLAGGGDFRANPRRWTLQSYEMVRTRVDRWSHDQLLD